jgi:plastocyanin
VSRIYLAVDEKAAIVVSGVVATLLFLGCLALASGRNVGRRLTAGLAGLALLSVVGAGAASAAKGERTIEHHPEAPITDIALRAQGIQYDKAALTVYEGKVRFTFKNDDPAATYHDVGIYSQKEAGQPFAAILPVKGGGERGSTLIDTKVVGLTTGTTYWFRCDFHPAMVGRLTVEPGPPPDTEHGGGFGVTKTSESKN